MTTTYTYAAPSITASGGTFATLQSGGLTAKLEALIAANDTATDDPTTAPSVSATGGGATGGALAAGDYYLKITETNGIGESLPSSETTQFTVGATNIPRVTFQTLQTGNTARNVYLTPKDGASGSEVLYATGITAATYDLAVAFPTTPTPVAPPSANTTGLSGRQISLIRAAESGNLQDVYRSAAKAVSNFCEGDGVSYQGLLSVLQDASVAFSVLKTALDETLVLLAANPGTLGTAATGIGGRKPVRTFS